MHIGNVSPYGSQCMFVVHVCELTQLSNVNNVYNINDYWSSFFTRIKTAGVVWTKKTKH